MSEIMDRTAAAAEAYRLQPEDPAAARAYWRDVTLGEEQADRLGWSSGQAAAVESAAAGTLVLDRDGAPRHVTGTGPGRRVAAGRIATLRRAGYLTDSEPDATGRRRIEATADGRAPAAGRPADFPPCPPVRQHQHPNSSPETRPGRAAVEAAHPPAQQKEGRVSIDEVPEDMSPEAAEGLQRLGILDEGATVLPGQTQGEEEAPYGYWPEPCATCGKVIPKAKASGAGRPPEYCDRECQNEKKAARARERNAPGLPGQVLRVEETTKRLEQVAADLRQELAQINSPEGIEARLAAARAANANDVAQANQETAQAKADAAAARSEASQARADREAAEAEADRDRVARETADQRRDEADQLARAAERRRAEADRAAARATEAERLAVEQAETATARAERAAADAAEAVRLRDAAVTERDQARQQAAAATARAEVADRERDRAEDRARQAAAERAAAERERDAAHDTAARASEQEEKARAAQAAAEERARRSEAERAELQEGYARALGEVRDAQRQRDTANAEATEAHRQRTEAEKRAGRADERADQADARAGRAEARADRLIGEAERRGEALAAQLAAEVEARREADRARILAEERAEQATQETARTKAAHGQLAEELRAYGREIDELREELRQERARPKASRGKKADPAVPPPVEPVPGQIPAFEEPEPDA
ncbi:hypothetical protein [Streptomyces sp. NPDC002913]